MKSKLVDADVTHCAKCGKDKFEVLWMKDGWVIRCTNCTLSGKLGLQREIVVFDFLLEAKVQ